MADGKLTFDTHLDSSGFVSGLRGLGSAASGIIKGVMGAITAVGTGLLAAGGYAIKVGSDFEAGMSEVSAISGATGADLDALREKAKEMGAATKFSASESAEAMKYMAMAGWDTNEMLGGLEGIMNLAAASGEDFGLVSDIVTDSLTAFGLSAADSSHFADVLAQAAAKSNTDIAMMGDTFRYVAPVAGALGYTAEDTAVAIGLMANAGIKGSQAGTALRSTLTRLIDPPKEAAQAMDALGISATNADGTMKPLNQLMGEMRSSFAGLDDAQQAQYASMIAGTEGMSGFLAIMNATDEDFASLTDSIYNADGAAQQMAETMQDNLQGQITILKSSVEGLGIEFYESIQEPLKNIAKTGIEYVNQLTEAFKTGGLTGLASELGTVFSNVSVKIAESVPQIIDTAVLVITSFIQGIQNNIPSLIYAASSILTSLVSGMSSMLPMLATSAIEIIGKLASEILLQLPLIVQMGLDLIVALATGIAQQLPTLIPQAYNAILTICEGLVDNLDQLIDAAILIIDALATGLIDSLPIMLEKAPVIVEKLCSAITDNFPKIMDLCFRLITTMAEAIVQNLPLMIKSGGKILSSIASGILSLIGKIAEAGGKIVRQLWDKITSTDWPGLGRSILEGIGQGIKNGVGAIWGAVKSAANGILNMFKSAFGINSPSRLFADEVGPYLPQGTIGGAEKEIPRQRRNIDQQAAELAAYMRASMEAENARMSSNVSASAEYRIISNNPSVQATVTPTPIKVEVENHMEIDGREFAIATSPYISEELAFSGG